MNKKKIIPVFMFLIIYSSVFAQGSSNETITISTYYPSVHGVHGILNLFPKDQEPLNPMQGDLYFNNTTENVMFYKNTTAGWVNLIGSAGGGSSADGLWNETSGHDIYNTNAGQVLFQGKPDANGVLMKVLGNIQLTDPRGSNIFYLNRRFDAAGSYRNAISFDTEGTIDYQIQHLQNPAILRIVKGPLPGEIAMAFNEDRVGIGTQDPLVQLQVEAGSLTSPLIVRNGAGTASQSGVVAITPYKDTVYLSYGCYLKDDDWIHDSFNDHNAKFSVEPDLGALWSASDDGTCSWDVAHGVVLWNTTGTWVAPCAPASSRSLKENFARLKTDDILAKINQLEVKRWNYRDEDESITHIGPVAEDFHRLFKTGSEENELHLIDSIGVSLAGVKALSEKINTQDRQIQNLLAEIEELKSKLKYD